MKHFKRKLRGLFILTAILTLNATFLFFLRNFSSDLSSAQIKHSGDCGSRSIVLKLREQDTGSVLKGLESDQSQGESKSEKRPVEITTSSPIVRERLIPLDLEIKVRSVLGFFL